MTSTTAFKLFFAGALALAGASSFAREAELAGQDWHEYDFLIETAHPYANEADESYPVTLEGAKRIRFLFSKVELEDEYDTVEVVDGNGRTVERITGNRTNYLSREIEGDFGALHFKSDDSQTRWGFQVTKVLVQY